MSDFQYIGKKKMRQMRKSLFNGICPCFNCPCEEFKCETCELLKSLERGNINGIEGTGREMR